MLLALVSRVPLPERVALTSTCERSDGGGGYSFRITRSNSRSADVSAEPLDVPEVASTLDVPEVASSTEAVAVAVTWSDADADCVVAAATSFTNVAEAGPASDSITTARCTAEMHTENVESCPSIPSPPLTPSLLLQV